ncbi:MAG: hypothetical protein HGA38_04555 [Candidatus Moranbacteria bacterium]|nr:hypothetical protein [Candidatus Moranbacteria bacterium]
MDNRGKRRISLFWFRPEGRSEEVTGIYCSYVSDSASKWTFVGLSLKKKMLLPCPEMADHFVPCTVTDIVGVLNSVGEDMNGISGFDSSIFVDIMRDPGSFVSDMVTIDSARIRVGRSSSNGDNWTLGLDRPRNPDSEAFKESDGKRGETYQTVSTSGESTWKGPLSKKAKKAPVMIRPDADGGSAVSTDEGIRKAIRRIRTASVAAMTSGSGAGSSVSKPLKESGERALNGTETGKRRGRPLGSESRVSTVEEDVNPKNVAVQTDGPSPSVSDECDKACGGTGQTEGAEKFVVPDADGHPSGVLIRNIGYVSDVLEKTLESLQKRIGALQANCFYGDGSGSASRELDALVEMYKHLNDARHEVAEVLVKLGE